MLNLTLSEVDTLFRPGDVVAVEYLHPDPVQEIIRVAEEGQAEHALCCMGGLDVVEAAIIGVQESSLRNYLRGNCRLTVRTANPTPEEAKRALDFWSARVGDPYDIRMVVGMAPILLAKNVLGYFYPAAGEWALCRMPNLLASSNLNTCAELAIKGLRQFRWDAGGDIPSENYDPETLRTDPTLTTKDVLDGAVLI
jgi:hypothetical protein